MSILAMRTKDAAKLLNSKVKDLESKLKGRIFRIGKEKMVSVFTLGEILNTTPKELLDLLEDFYLGELIEKVESDEVFEFEEALKFYRKKKL